MDFLFYFNKWHIFGKFSILLLHSVGMEMLILIMLSIAVDTIYLPTKSNRQYPTVFSVELMVVLNKKLSIVARVELLP